MSSAFKAACTAFAKLPGLGRRSAERLVFHLLAHKSMTTEVLTALKRVIQEMQPCSTCGLISETNPCKICSTPTREQKLICVVKTAHDAFRIERSGGFNGLYHVLGGLLSPLAAVDEQDLTIAQLCTRVRGQKKELLLAFEDSLEGVATAQLLRERLSNENGLRFTRMAVGLPVGAGLEHIDSVTLKHSLAQRKQLDDPLTQ